MMGHASARGMRMRPIAMAALLAAVLATGATGLAYSATSGMPVLDISSMFSTYFSATSWYGIAMLLAIAVISIAALVYMLSKFVGSQNAALWARVQIYEALIGIVFIAILFGFYSWMLVNPQPTLGAIGLVPSQCTSASDIYALSSCDLGSFLSQSTDWFSFIYYVSYVWGLTGGFKASFTVPPGAMKVSTSLSSILPASGEEMFAIVFDLLMPAIMLNELQMILLAAAPLMFGLLLAVGILAWMVGFSRRFGGTLIALAIGVGVIYPLLVAITYGFIEVKVSAFMPVILSQLALFLQGILSGLLSLQFTNMTSLVAALFSSGSYVFAGLVLVPLLNFMILDAFVTDFSKAIGIRMTFMELIMNLA